MARKRLLFLAEGATMQHFVRPLALADSLDPSRYEIQFFAPSRYSRHLTGKPYMTAELPTMPGEIFLENLAKGAPLFPASVLRSYVAEERRLMQRLKPDWVLGDLRFSLPVSARLEGVPSAILMNAYWSPYAGRRGVIPELPLTRVIPPRWLGGFYRLTEPLALSAHVRAINSVRREVGFPPLPPDPRYMYTDGDYVLYPDVPEFVPTKDLPSHHRYIGPCNWELPGELPEWWSRMLDDPRPKALISLGSSGPVRILPRLLSVFSRLGVSVILTTSGRTAPPANDGLYVASLVPFAQAAAAAKLVVSHGGSSGFYPALAVGTPVLGIPSNADQQIAGAVLAESGAGINVRVEEASERALQQAIEAIMTDGLYKETALRWKSVFSRYDTATLFNNFLDEVLGPPNSE